MRSALIRSGSRRQRPTRQQIETLSPKPWTFRSSSLTPFSSIQPPISSCFWYRREFFSTSVASDFDTAFSTDNEAITKTSNDPRRRFEDLDLHPKSLKALRRHGLHELTEIQEKTYDVIVSGKDVVGRARTGTGKTLSFLLPALERVIQKHEAGTLKPGIAILILSPTRELAAQITKEAERLVAQHDTSKITSQVVFGGSSRGEDIDRFNKQLPTILVATPGRLKDHLASTQLHDGGKDSVNKRPFVDALQNLQVLVLDETDRLLDMGFRRDVTDILSCLPRGKRQTLLFSATLPHDVREVVELAARPDYVMIDCIQDEDPATQTNAHTEQTYVVVPTQQFWTKTLEYLLDLVDKGDNKVMVFFPMTSMVELYGQIFNIRFGRRVWELHGKMHQRERTTISQRFRNSNKGTLFTSDVSARGVDYPNVTHVVQIGASGSRETYIHRLGRTGRAGKRGKGLLLLPEVERDFLDELEGLEITTDKEWNDQLVVSPPSRKLMNELGPMVQKIRSGRDSKLEKSIRDAYQAMISYYFQRCNDKPEVVATVNRLIEVMGLSELPAIDLRRARRIGLDTVPGFNIQSDWKDQSWTTGWGDNGASQAPARFGKPYGDFHGKFGMDDRIPRKYRSQPDSEPHDDWRSDDSPGRKKDTKKNDARHPSWQGREDRPKSRRPSDNNRDDRSLDAKRSNQFSRAFTKVGWKKNEEQNFPGKPAFAKKKAGKATFTRWEADGEFRFRN